MQRLENAPQPLQPQEGEIGGGGVAEAAAQRLGDVPVPRAPLPDRREEARRDRLLGMISAGVHGAQGSIGRVRGLRGASVGGEEVGSIYGSDEGSICGDLEGVPQEMRPAVREGGL